MLVHCRSIRQSVRLCTDCLSANQIKEFVAYFNQYTITANIVVGLDEYLLIILQLMFSIDGDYNDLRNSKNTLL